MIAVVALGPGGLALAQRLVAELPDATLHGYAPRIADAAVRFDDVAGHLGGLFADGQPIVALCAAGIVIRSLAPLLRDKRTEPAVVAVAEDGSVAVPLLGGHHGANDLARQVAAIVGGVAAITTAGDVRLGLALDDPPPGWRIANPAAAKIVTAALLAGERVDLEIGSAEADCGWLRAAGNTAPGESTGRARPGPDPGSTMSMVVTDRVQSGGDRTLILHPATLAVGIGCERGASADEVRALVMQCLAQANLSPLAVAGIFSIALKAAEPAIHAVAQELGVPARFFPAEVLLAETPRLSERSDVVFRETGCWGVAEGAALAAAGPQAALALAKQRSARAIEQNWPYALTLRAYPSRPAGAVRIPYRPATPAVSDGSVTPCSATSTVALPAARSSPVVPFDNPVAWTLASQRVGNYQSSPHWGPLLSQLWVR
jgi:cobalt-precorrin 5A hydrolase/precorrin-3B C17-methyltransferase